MKRTLAIAPAFNEEGSIAEAVADLTNTVPAIEILIVNNASLDSTSGE